MTTGAALAIQVHHHFHGPSTDYLGLGAASALSWLAVSGPGEAALIAAGILAARHRLDITEVVLIAWLGATAGGCIGWVIGLRGGRALVTGPGPLRELRVVMTDRAERFYERLGPVAVFLTPSWTAGTVGMPWRRFAPANVVAALLWALLVGLGAYFLGPRIEDALQGIGIVATILVLTIAAVGAVAAFRGRKRRRAERRSA